MVALREMSFADQSEYSIRFEWGLPGLQATGTDAIIVLVDILSFTTSVSVACARGATVFPCRWHDGEASDLARRENAQLASRRGSESSDVGRFSLSPESLLRASPELRLVLPSQNGSVVAYEGMRQNRIVVAASIRNATAIASWLSRQDSAVSVIAAGERWNDGTWRFAIEDLLGAGAPVLCPDEHVIGVGGVNCERGFVLVVSRYLVHKDVDRRLLQRLRGHAETQRRKHGGGYEQ